MKEINLFESTDLVIVGSLLENEPLYRRAERGLFRPAPPSIIAPIVNWVVIAFLKSGEGKGVCYRKKGLWTIFVGESIVCQVLGRFLTDNWPAASPTHPGA